MPQLLRLAVVAALLVTFAAIAADAPVGVVCNVKVLSDKVEDVSSLEAWKRSFIKEGMTDEEKAKAIWRTVVMFQHQDDPPVEFLQNENVVLDTIRIFNVYGYSFCGVAASHVQCLARYAGLQARGWTIKQHVVSEVYWDGSWHLLDASLINYFPKADGKLASVEEVIAGLKAWYETHPELKGNDAKLREFMRNGGWRKGPDILSRCPFYSDSGWLPAKTHGWYSTMQEYDGSVLFPYECGYSQGYQVNVQLRQGERLTRNWFNRGLHVNMDKGNGPGCMTTRVGEGFLSHTPQYGDLAPGRVGNGTLEYDVPLADGAFRLGALAADNLACKSEDTTAPAVHVKQAAQPGTLIVRMPSSYVYLGGELSLKAVVGEGGSIAVGFSDNNGLDWQDVASITASGDQKIDLKGFVFRRYDYRLKFTMKGEGTGLDVLKITHDIQHSQRPLPALAQGTNSIRFSAGPQEGTITIEGSTEKANKGKQLLYTDFHPEARNLREPQILIDGNKGEITFPIETPGEMLRLRFGCFYRARDKAEGWGLQASFDGGKTFKTCARAEGPSPWACKWITVDDVPPGTRSALVRYSGNQTTAAMLFNIRIDADYKQPHGGFRPVKITYVWEEGGVEKRDVHVAKQPKESYNIRCEGKPVMRSVAVEVGN